MTALLRNAIKPNLVQSLEGNPVFVHGGPFANIAHGCSSVMATRMALNLADYVVTECGFGADLGAEKFLHIKCSQTGLWPHAAVCVATLRALKYHGGVKLGSLSEENISGLEKGLANLKRHVENLKKFNLPVIVSLNEFPSDTPRERELLKGQVNSWGAEVVFSNPYGAGGEGCVDLAQAVKALSEANSIPLLPRPLYQSENSLAEKIRTVATQIYGAKEVAFSPSVKKQLEAWEAEGYRTLPVCMAKTQYSFSSNPKLLGAPSDHMLEVQAVRLSAGAGFVVVICGDLLLMPGLPKVPASQQIDCDENGNVFGL
jgi:formate--tetrahydrofolate ligase